MDSTALWYCSRSARFPACSSGFKSNKVWRTLRPLPARFLSPQGNRREEGRGATPHRLQIIDPCNDVMIDFAQPESKLLQKIRNLMDVATEKSAMLIG